MRKVARFFTGPVMFLAGINHFVMPDAYESIVPDALPMKRELVYASGVAEILGALGSMHPRTRRPAGMFLIATLVAVFPANVFMAANAERYPDVPGGEVALLARLPLQALFIYWVWLATQTKDEGALRPPRESPVKTS
jgi:uncharacterized membrane protein